MMTLSTPLIILAALGAIALGGRVVWYVAHKNKNSDRLRTRFGSEYVRAVEGLGGQAKAESALQALERRVEALNLSALTPEDVARFDDAWQVLQVRFIDNPSVAVVRAGKLVREVMSKRGYPTAEFETSAGDLSVDHALVVDNYRAAQAIAVRAERGEADTEALRTAVVHYRALFEELLKDKSDERNLTVPEHVAA